MLCNPLLVVVAAVLLAVVVCLMSMVEVFVVLGF
jgi:uncharacterized membrane protein